MRLPDWETVQGDTGSALRWVLRDGDGRPLDLNAASVAGLTFTMSRYGRPGVKVDGREATVLQQGAGEAATDMGLVEYSSWEAAELDEPGWFLGRFTVTYAGEKPASYPVEPLLIFVAPSLG